MEGCAYGDVFLIIRRCSSYCLFHIVLILISFDFFVVFVSVFPIQLFVTDQEIRAQAEQHLAQAIEAQYVR